MKNLIKETIVKGMKIFLLYHLLQLLQKFLAIVKWNNWQKYPDYGFEKNMGYGTTSHMKAIVEKGTVPIHRVSF